jgi:cytochrome c556
MIRAVLAVAAVAAVGLGVTVASAQDPIAARQQLMKDTGAQAQIGAKMVRGEEPFSVDKAKAIFAQYVKTSEQVKPLFAENKPGKTAAMAAIWSNKADFDAKLAKFGADAKAALDKVTDMESFKANFGPVQRNCGGCHENYRAKQS